MVECNCGKRYVGETKLKVKSRISQHQKTVTDEKWETSGIPLHAENWIQMGGHQNPKTRRT